MFYNTCNSVIIDNITIFVIMSKFMIPCAWYKKRWKKSKRARCGVNEKGQEIRGAMAAIEIIKNCPLQGGKRKSRLYCRLYFIDTNLYILGFMNSSLFPVMINLYPQHLRVYSINLIQLVFSFMPLLSPMHSYISNIFSSSCLVSSSLFFSLSVISLPTFL